MLSVLHYDPTSTTEKIAVATVILILLAYALIDLYLEFKLLKNPLRYHFDGILDALPAERELLSKLLNFPVYSLTLAEQRLEMESRNVTVKLNSLIGENSKYSIFGIATIAYAWLQQRGNIFFDSAILTIVAALSFFALLGASLAILMLRLGTGKSAHYADLIRLSINLKNHDTSATP
ncbi:MAG: hypothetical protein QM756_29695 [Polyangiaceae bacterium]